MTKILAVLVGVLAILLLGTTAQAKPAPAPQPYTLDQEIIKETVYPKMVDGVPQPTQITLTCPSGKVVTGGGFDSGSTYLAGGEDFYNSPIRRSHPSGPNMWIVEFDPDRQATGVADVTAFAVCVNGAAPTS